MSRARPLTAKRVAWDLRNAAKGQRQLMRRINLPDTAQLDYADLRVIAEFVEGGYYHAARDRAARLDTAVRDELPKSFFALLEQNGVRW